MNVKFEKITIWYFFGQNLKLVSEVIKFIVNIGKCSSPKNTDIKKGSITNRDAKNNEIYLGLSA